MLYLTQKELDEKLAYARYEALREAENMAAGTPAGVRIRLHCDAAWQSYLACTPRGPHQEALPTTAQYQVTYIASPAH